MAIIGALVIPVAGQILLSCVAQFGLIQRRFAATKILNQCFVGMDLETMGQIESQLRQRTLFVHRGSNEWSVTVPVEVDENNNYTDFEDTIWVLEVQSNRITNIRQETAFQHADYLARNPNYFWYRLQGAYLIYGPVILVATFIVCFLVDRYRPASLGKSPEL